MAEYIEREALKEKFWGACKNCLSEDDIADLIDDVPAANVAPVVHGEWVRYKEPQNPYRGNGTSYKCSVCGRTAGHHQVKLYKYCPKCGAKMDGGEKANE